jgi:small subunit ribosomal protein S17e
MGSIKTSFVKRIGNELFENNSGLFTGDYSKNKEVIKGLIGIKSKKLRNIIAGYITNLKNQERKV